MKYFFILFILLVNTSIIAQKLKVAPVIGINMSSIYYSNDAKEDLENVFKDFFINNKVQYKPILRGVVGVWGDYALSDRLNFRTGLLVNLKGGKLQMKGNDADGDYKITLKYKFTYLEIPLLVAYQIGEKPIRILVGPVLNFAVGGKVDGYGKYKSNGELRTYSTEEKIHIGNESNEIKFVDLGLNLGISKEVNLLERPLEISFSLSPSLSKFTSDPNNSSQYFGRNLSLSLKTAYFFSFE